jgi:hypothetical protein
MGPVDSTDASIPSADLGQQTLGKIQCVICDGSGLKPVYDRATREVGSPKDEALADILDDHEDIGRLVVWAGFEGSVNRCVDICRKEGWTVLKIDGKGWVASSPDGRAIDVDELLIAMDGSHKRKKELAELYPRVVVVGNPKAGGMGLTFTASPTEVYYSNSFDGEARVQSEDRIHRMGMDVNRGCLIIDLVCLKTDETVLNNLKLKRPWARLKYEY